MSDPEPCTEIQLIASPVGLSRAPGLGPNSEVAPEWQPQGACAAGKSAAAASAQRGKCLFPALPFLSWKVPKLSYNCGALDSVTFADLF